MRKIRRNGKFHPVEQIFDLLRIIIDIGDFLLKKIEQEITCWRLSVLKTL